MPEVVLAGETPGPARGGGGGEDGSAGGKRERRGDVGAGEPQPGSSGLQHELHPKLCPSQAGCQSPR